MRPTCFVGRAHAENAVGGDPSAGGVGGSEEEGIQHPWQVVRLLAVSRRVTADCRALAPVGVSHLGQIAGSSLAEVTTMDETH